ncbi:hypothetical protein Vadar_032937 [Vaccinium darrowii]|uniref:Uncharacterized protein n=1 Tax=Vaccinium darrowii TaxID=229202 RepID=A0ACB7ZN46_9ERIC|nr:hypothetical protein Vadar_032937 [Vaccinium darrowii]
MEYHESLEDWRVKNLEEIARKVAVHRKCLQSEYGLSSSNDDVSANVVWPVYQMTISANAKQHRRVRSIEDSRILDGIKWGMLIADECQSWTISGHLSRIKELNAHMKLLLVYSRVKVWCFLNRSAVAKFRAEAIYIEFLKQWNVGVYFSLRFQEIDGSLDSALTVASLVPIQISHSDKGNSQHLTINQSATRLECLMSCWREDVLVLSCSDKFLRLSLQLISRYSHWVSAGLAARKAGNAGSTPGSEWAIYAVPDDFIYDLKQLKGITATYRMTNKPLPVRHSPYVSGVLRPLKARKTESSLQRIRQGAQRRAGASSDVSDNNVRILTRSVCNYFLIFRNMGATSLHWEFKQ